MRGLRRGPRSLGRVRVPRAWAAPVAHVYTRCVRVGRATMGRTGLFCFFFSNELFHAFLN